MHTKEGGGTLNITAYNFLLSTTYLSGVWERQSSEHKPPPSPSYMEIKSFFYIKVIPNILQAEKKKKNEVEKWLSLDKEKSRSTAIKSLSSCNTAVYLKIKKSI